MSKTIIIDDSPEWKGYTLDEIKYRRIIEYTKCEMAKEQLLAQSQSFGSQILLPKTFGGKILSSITGKMNVIDYLLMGYKVSRKLFPLINGIKKKLRK